MVTRLGYGASVPQCEVAQGSRGKPFLQLIVGAGGGPGGSGVGSPAYRFQGRLLLRPRLCGAAGGHRG